MPETYRRDSLMNRAFKVHECFSETLIVHRLEDSTLQRDDKTVVGVCGYSVVATPLFSKQISRVRISLAALWLGFTTYPAIGCYKRINNVAVSITRNYGNNR